MRTWERDVSALRTGDGRTLPPHLLAELDRLRQRLVLTMKLIHEDDAELVTALAAAPDEAASQKVTALQCIRGIGENFAGVLVKEPQAVSQLCWPDAHGLSEWDNG